MQHFQCLRWDRIFTFSWDALERCRALQGISLDLRGLLVAAYLLLFPMVALVTSCKRVTLWERKIVQRRHSNVASDCRNPAEKIKEINSHTYTVINLKKKVYNKMLKSQMSTSVNHCAFVPLAHIQQELIYFCNKTRVEINSFLMLISIVQSLADCCTMQIYYIMLYIL